MRQCDCRADIFHRHWATANECFPGSAPSRLTQRYLGTSQAC
jgi:hypothetical protein